VKAGTSFLLGIAVGVLAVVVVDRARKMIREEDVDALKDRIAEGLKSLEGTMSGLAEGLSETFSEVLD
jgi:hypothetical protein